MLESVAILRPVSPEGLSYLAAKGSVRHFAAGSPLMIQGEVGEAMYAIRGGRVRVEHRIDGGNHAAAVLAELGPGEIVGEMGILDGEPRSATVTAITDVEALELTAGVLTEAMVQHADIGKALLHVVSRRLRDMDDLVAQIGVGDLSKHPAFKAIPLEALTDLACKGRRRRFPAGAALMSQGDSSETLHLIRSGWVRVERGHPQMTAPVLLAELGPGEVVGEMGVLDGAPRSATVVAIDSVETLELDIQALSETTLRHPEITLALLRTISERLRSVDGVVGRKMDERWSEMSGKATPGRAAVARHPRSPPETKPAHKAPAWWEQWSLQDAKRKKEERAQWKC
ncbi:MAG: Crp/Fnr family transcriptional regulator [Chloroflexota bacterium]